MKLPCTSWLAAAALSTCPAFSNVPATLHQGDPATPPNVVVVLLDDVGVDRVGVYQAHPDPGRTPVLDSLAQRGLRFTQAWAMSSCSPTRACLLTGRFPSRHGIGAQISPTNDSHPQLEASELILPEALPQHSSRVVGKWHLKRSTSPDTHPLDLGFGGHVGSMYNIGSSGYWDWRRFVDGVWATEPRYATSITNRDAIRALRDLPEPYFLYVAFNAAHGPFHVPPAHLHSYGQPTSQPMRYRAMMEALDTELARLLQHIDLRTTYLFVMGDNGTPIPAVDGPSDPAKAKGSLYEGGLHVPLFVLGPGVPVGTSHALVSVTDLFATITELCGQGATPEDSISFVDLLQDSSHPGYREFLYSEKFKIGDGPAGFHARTIRTHRYKWLSNQTGTYLFDLHTDPWEVTNRIGDPSLAQVRARLEAALPVFP